MSEPLKWVSESLEEVAEDREADGDEESVPLLPLSEDAIQAMDNPDFLNLLRSLGIMPPSDEQETYWRIPGHLNHHELRNRISVINDALEGRLASGSQDDGAEDSVTTAEQGDNDAASLSKIQDSDENSVPGNSTNTSQSLKPSLPTNMQIDSESEPEMPNTSISKKSKESKKRKTWADFVNSESESQDNMETRHKNKKSNRIIKPVSDDSNSEDELSNQRSQNQNEAKTSENNEMKSKNIANSLLDSDSEDENNTNVFTNKRARRALTDSESDTEQNHMDQLSRNNTPRDVETISKTENKTKRLRILNSDDED